MEEKKPRNSIGRQINRKEITAYSKTDVLMQTIEYKLLSQTLYLINTLSIIAVAIR